MIIRQNLILPKMITKNQRAILICPGFPPALTLFPFRKRIIPYVHDTFLLSRWNDLNLRAKTYMALPFKLAMSTYPRFFVNSETTSAALRGHCQANAEIMLYRPKASNTFEVASKGRNVRSEILKKLRLFSMGTIEPRKNFRAAANIVAALRAKGLDATLEIAGRRGWGNDWAYLQSAAHVELLGYAAAADVKMALERADIFLCTSHDEGLGLPILEAQHAGLPVFVPDRPIFHEVLGETGIYIEPAEPKNAADIIVHRLCQSGWRQKSISQAEQNLARWNAIATDDQLMVTKFLARMIAYQNQIQ
jgi:glycosyltransferase involved in cell wall biosynthesis